MQSFYLSHFSGIAPLERLSLNTTVKNTQQAKVASFIFYSVSKPAYSFISVTIIYMRVRLLLLAAAFVIASQYYSLAQTNTANLATVIHTNTAIIPVPRTDAYVTNRQALVLQRARSAPGNYDIEFIGDSITQHWEEKGSKVWQQYYGHRKVINMGVSGDRTEHVLWRFEQGQLDGIKAKVAVLMIGTNNNFNKTNTEEDILEGILAIVHQIRTRQPETKILLLGIFPSGQKFCLLRGRLLQINQVLAKFDDGQHVFYTDFGFQFVERDGSISKAIMPDALHPSEAGYKIWAEAMEPKLKQLLGQ